MFKNLSTLLVFAFILQLTISCSSEDAKTIVVSDYGIVANTKKSITADINKLIDEVCNEPVTIVFPKGRYDFFPDEDYTKHYYETNTYDVNPKRLAIFLSHRKNVTIDAQGSDFIFHDHIQPFTVDNSENITIKNVNIDWEIPLTAESEVIEASPKHILLKIDTTQFPYKMHPRGVEFQGENWTAHWGLSEGSWLIEIGKNHIIPANTGDNGCVKGDMKNLTYTEKEPGIVLIEGEFTRTPAIGSRLIMRHSTRDHAGMFLFHSKNLKLQDVNVYHTSGLGILSQYCENIEMERVNMIPNPKKNRYLSGHDDGLHFMGCKGEIVINDCDAQGLMDDPINIHGTCVPVVEKLNEKTVKCKFAHDMSCGLLWAEPGDKVSFIKKNDMNSVAIGYITKFESLNKDTFLLTFKDNVPAELSAEYSIENLTWTANATITNCFVGSCRARGYLISTPGKVLIENNIFETSGSAILIAGDANAWYESGAVTDVTIRNNEFRSSCNSSFYQFCNAIISIYPEIPEPDVDKPFHKNITIENNTFNPSDFPILYAISVDGLKFNNNKVTRSYDFEPWHFYKSAFILDACKNVEIIGNDFSKDVLSKEVKTNRMLDTDYIFQ